VVANPTPRWYGPGEPKKVFVERKTHRESWKGEESVKERFTLDEDKVVPFLEMEYGLEQVGGGELGC
jgi:SPX domain protein involved in polyphosphate accumulation